MAFLDEDDWKENTASYETDQYWGKITQKDVTEERWTGKTTDRLFTCLL